MSLMNVDDLIEIVEGKRPMVEAHNHPLLPQHTPHQPFRWLLSGLSGCGKTNCVVCPILQGNIKFDKLYLCTKSPDQDKYRFLIKWCNTIKEKVKETHGSDVDVIEICEDVSQIPHVQELDPTIVNLMIFDDLLLEADPENKIESYFIRGRHTNANCIYMSQSYYKTPKKIRENCTYFSIFATSSRKEIIQLASEHALHFPYEKFKEIFVKATAPTSEMSHPFIFLDRVTSIPQMRIRKCFDHFYNEKTDRFEFIDI